MPTYDEGTRFHEGRASVRVGNHWGIIDELGNFVVPPGPFGWCRFREGVAAIRAKGKWGVIDRTGNFVVAPTYEYLESFYEGFAVFNRADGERVHYGFINKVGEEIISPVFQNAYHFSEGLAAAQVGQLWGYINTAGSFSITPRFESTGRTQNGKTEKKRAGYFVRGLAPVWTDKGYRFIDNTEKFVGNTPFDEAWSFKENRALVRFGGRFGFVDNTGEVTIRPQFTYASDFSEKLAVVREEEYRLGFVPPCGFIDESGNTVLSPRFYRAVSFEDGLCLVTTKDSIGYINKAGEFVWKGPLVEYGVLL